MMMAVEPLAICSLQFAIEDRESLPFNCQLQIANYKSISV